MPIPKLGTSTTSLEALDIYPATGEYLKNLGFEILEINLNFFPLSWSKRKHSRIREIAANNSLELTLHTPNALLDPVNSDEFVAESSLNMMKSVMKLADILDVSCIIVHTTWYHSSLEENIRAFEEIKKSTRREIIYENSGSGVGASERDIDTILDELKLRMNLDVGHLWRAMKHGWVKSGLEDFFSMFSDRIAYSHLHDNFGNEDLHYALGKGSLPVDDVLRLLYENKVGRWIIEVHKSQDIAPSLRKIRDFLKKNEPEG